VRKSRESVIPGSYGTSRDFAENHEIFTNREPFSPSTGRELSTVHSTVPRLNQALDYSKDRGS